MELPRGLASAFSSSDSEVAEEVPEAGVYVLDSPAGVKEDEKVG